jgi:hypothetical protein
VRDYFFGAPFEFGARQENAPPALHTTQTYISPQAHNQPFIAAAGMDFAQA